MVVLITRAVLAVCLLGWLTFPAPATATSIAAPPSISITVADTGFGIPGFSDLRFTYQFIAGSRLSVTVSVTAGLTTPPATADVYIGAMQPGGGLVSWVPGASAPTLQAGLAPIARGVTFSPYSIAGLGYAFSGAEARGLYIIHAILVTPGADPGDARNWISAGMVPVVFSP